MKSSRESLLIKSASADALALIALLDLPANDRDSSRAKIADAATAAEKAVLSCRTAQEKSEAVQSGISNIEMNTIQVFWLQSRLLSERIEKIRTNNLHRSTEKTLSLLENRLGRAEGLVLSFGRDVAGGGQTIQQLSRSPAEEYDLIKTIVDCIEQSASDLKSWGTRRDIILRVVIGLAIGLLLVPVSVVAKNIYDGWQQARAESSGRMPDKST